MKTLSILIPFYNEEKTIATLMEKVMQQKLDQFRKEIILIDDGSNDQSIKRLAPWKNEIQLIQLEQNYGRGKALRMGITAAKGDLLIFQDADLEYNPQDWPRLIAAYEPLKHPVVYGSRTISPTQNGYLAYVLGARFLTRLVNLLYRSNLTDVYTGYKLFNTKLIQSLPLTSNGFELEIEITTQLLLKGIQIAEVPIQYWPRNFQEGKKITARDGIIGGIKILEYWFKK
jgi:dolichol-phosphate mannosyltransferase